MNTKYFGLCKDDGLGILRNTSGPEADQKHKKIIKIFQECGLSITCEITKSELGKLSKHILQKINNEVRLNLTVNQWQNSSESIEWFKNIHNKNAHTFTVFDIQEFYPSIKEDLLRDAVSFAQNCIDIHSNEIEVIFHSGKSLLYHNNKPWIKNDGNGEFDVTMGSYDGAEVCEVVALFMLDIISKKYLKENIGLYRDDGLSVFKNQTGHQNDKVRKELICIIQDHHLKLEIKCNLKSVDYLDINYRDLQVI